MNQKQGGITLATGERYAIGYHPLVIAAYMPLAALPAQPKAYPVEEIDRDPSRKRENDDFRGCHWNADKKKPSGQMLCRRAA